MRPGAPSWQRFKLDQTFFGLKPADRVYLHEQIFDLIWHGEGRWDWDTIYNMPVHLRKFYVKKLNKIFDDQNKQIQQQQSKKSSAPKIAKPPR